MHRLFDWLAAAGDRASARGTRLLGGRTMRLAWLAVACLVAVPMLLMGTIQVSSMIAHEEITLVSAFAAAGVEELDISNGAGSTRVVGVDGADTVTVRARVSDGLRDTDHRTFRRGGSIVVRGSCPVVGGSWCSVDYTIEVPTELTVRVDGDDKVVVSDVTGTLDVDVDQGSVQLDRVGGDVTVSADQGSVDGSELTAARLEAHADQGSIDLTFATSPRAIATEADQGSIDIVLPDEAGVAYATQTQADQGTVTTRIREDPASGRSITADADQGSIAITYAP